MAQSLYSEVLKELLCIKNLSKHFNENRYCVPFNVHNYNSSKIGLNAQSSACQLCSITASISALLDINLVNEC